MSKRYGGVEGDMDGPAFTAREMEVIASFKKSTAPQVVNKNMRCRYCGKQFDTPLEVDLHQVYCTEQK